MLRTRLAAILLLGALAPWVCAVALAAMPGEPCVEDTDCDDRDACTHDRCGTDGLCELGYFGGCDPHNGCVYSQCDPVEGCQYPAIPGRCDQPGVVSTIAFVTWTLADGAVKTAHATRYDPDVMLWSDGAVEISFYTPESSISLTFRAPDDRPLVPGVYEGASASEERPAGTPAVIVTASPFWCDEYVARFVVHEAVHEVHGWRDVMQGFAVDFTLRCLDTAEMTEAAGIFRYRAGDAGCRDAVDGTSCDDRNACTARSECRGGLCVGDDSVQCATPTDGCHLTPECNPMSGECLPPPALEDGTDCADPARCITDGTCAAGTCTSDLVPCNDFDVCTRDVCEGDHRCVNRPIDGTCWSLKGTATFTATAFGASCSCETRAVPPPIAMLNDGTFARPGGVVERCDAIVPEEVGIARRVGRGRRKLASTNVQGVRDALFCDNPPRLLERRAWVKMNRVRGTLRGLQVERVTLEDSPIDLTTAVRFRGRPATSGTNENTNISLGRCAEQLIDCLNEKLQQ